MKPQRQSIGQWLNTSKELEIANQQSLLLAGGVLVSTTAMTVMAYVQDELTLTGIGIAGSLIAALNVGYRAYINYRQSRADERGIAQRLQTQLERANAVYQFANIISQTLDYNTALNRALDIEQLFLRPKYKATNIIAAALLFRQEDNRLHVATAHHLNRQDFQVAVPATSGILAEALEGRLPIFGGDGVQDSELRNFAAFQSAKSLLVIPLRQGYESYGVLVFGSAQINAFDPSAREALAAIGTQVSIALKNAVLYQSILDDKERIVSIDEQARKKLSRDLHDGPTQTIAIIASISSVIQKYLKQNNLPKAHDELDKVQQLAQKTTKEIRHLLFSLRPLVLENKGLIAALNELAKKMADTYGQQVFIEADPKIEQLLDADDQGTVFYIIEEAINNAYKHAQAQTIWARLQIHAPYMIIEIEDNGQGFNVEAVNTDYHKRGSLGMVNLRERSEMLRGEFSIDSQPGRGTKITVMVPMPDDTNRPQANQKSQVPASATTMAKTSRMIDEQVTQNRTQPPSSWSDLSS